MKGARGKEGEDEGRIVEVKVGEEPGRGRKELEFNSPLTTLSLAHASSNVWFHPLSPLFRFPSSSSSSNLQLGYLAPAWWKKSPRTSNRKTLSTFYAPPSSSLFLSFSIFLPLSLSGEGRRRECGDSTAGSSVLWLGRRRFGPPCLPPSFLLLSLLLLLAPASRTRFSFLSSRHFPDHSETPYLHPSLYTSKSYEAADPTSSKRPFSNSRSISLNSAQTRVSQTKRNRTRFCLQAFKLSYEALSSAIYKSYTRAQPTELTNEIPSLPREGRSGC